MKSLHITLFVIGNVLLFGQLGIDLHRLVWGIETSVFDEFNPTRSKVRSGLGFETLIADYRKLRIDTEALEKSKSEDEIKLIKKEHQDLYDRLYETRSELSEREDRGRELRDTWAYSGYGVILILIGFFSYHRGQQWVGIALTLSGFTILEYWASPPLFGGAVVEFRELLWSKTALTLIALGLLYASFSRVNRSNATTQ